MLDMKAHAVELSVDVKSGDKADVIQAIEDAISQLKG